MTHHCISSSLILFHLALHVCHRGREWWRVAIDGHRWALMEVPKLAYGCMIFAFLSRNSLQIRLLLPVLFPARTLDPLPET